MENNTKKRSIFKTIIAVILIVMVIFFIAIMLIPDDEEEENVAVESESVSVEQTVSSVPAEEGTTDVIPVTVGTDAKSATIMIYMNGSDLETNAGEASQDISEMLESGIGKNVNVVIQTMGTKEWQNYGISSDTAQTYKIENGGLALVRDNLGQLDCTSKDTLSEFISFCKTSYPADRYILLFWNHGGGPVYGFGYDEWQEEGEGLTINEMVAAFSENSDVHFDIIGMDCCIMASLETCYAFEPYCKYAILSEDFESGLGWDYRNWMKVLETNPGISSPLLGKYVVDDIIADNESDEYGTSACMGLFNMTAAKDLFTAWKDYAYKNEEALFNTNYSRIHEARGRGFWDSWLNDSSDVTLSDYYISDILALMESVDKTSSEAIKLMSTLKAIVTYYGHTSDKNELTGLAVSLPYGDSYFYDQLKSVFKGIDIDDEYIKWLEGFVSSYGNDEYYDYEDFEQNWGGWSSYEDEYGCNISGGSCEYGYDYGNSEGSYSGDENYADDWIYDYEEDIWYLYENNTLYLYDEKEDMMFYYDEDEDKYYYYDYDKEDWFEY